MRHARRHVAATVLGLIVAGAMTPAAKAGFLYLSNGDGTISRIDTATNAETGIAILGRSSPEGLTLDSLGNLYVVDAFNQRIDRVTSSGVLSIFSSGLYVPVSLAIDGRGNLYELGQTGDINRISPSGGVSLFATAQSYSSSLAIDPAGNLYDASATRGTIQRITPGGIVSTYAIGLNLENPSALTFDPAGNLYVGDFINGIERITPSGVVNILAPASNPHALAFDTAGNLYVANGGNFTIERITPGGAVSFIANESSSPYALAFQASPSAVPEPASLVMFGVGLVGVGGYLHLRRGR